MKFELPWPPSVNHYWIQMVRGRKVIVAIGQRGQEFRRQVAEIVGEMTPLEGPLAVRIEAYFPDRRKRDLDNLLKAPLDALEHAGLYKNDGQIRDLHILGINVVPGGKLVVEIQEIKNDQ